MPRIPDITRQELDISIEIISSQKPVDFEYLSELLLEKVLRMTAKSTIPSGTNPLYLKDEPTFMLMF